VDALGRTQTPDEERRPDTPEILAGGRESKWDVYDGRSNEGRRERGECVVLAGGYGHQATQENQRKLPQTTMRYIQQNGLRAHCGVEIDEKTGGSNIG
jgi:hypothetical protein